MCAGANSSAATVSKIDLLIIPLIKKTADGMMDRANTLNIPFFFQQTIQRMQYTVTSRASRMIYRAKDSLDAQPNQAAYGYHTSHLTTDLVTNHKEASSD